MHNSSGLLSLLWSVYMIAALIVDAHDGKIELSDELYDEIEKAVEQSLAEDEFENIYDIATWNEPSTGLGRLRDWKSFDEAVVRVLRDSYEELEFRKKSRDEKEDSFVRLYHREIVEPCMKLLSVYSHYEYEFEHACFASSELHHVKDIIETCKTLATESKRSEVGKIFLSKIVGNI